MSSRALVIALACAAVVASAVVLARMASSAPARAASSAVHAPAGVPSMTGADATASPTPSSGPRPSLANASTARPSAVPGLETDLRDPDPKVRRAAIAEVARTEDVDPSVLARSVRDPDAEVGVIAAISLGAAYQRGAVPASEIVALVDDRSLDERVRMSALNGVGSTPSPDAVALLLRMSTRGQPIERSAAAILLRHQDPDLAIPALIAALSDPHDDVRANAAESLRSRARGRDFGSDPAAWSAWWSARAR